MKKNKNTRGSSLPSRYGELIAPGEQGKVEIDILFGTILGKSHESIGEAVDIPVDWIDGILKSILKRNQMPKMRNLLVMLGLTVFINEFWEDSVWSVLAPDERPTFN